MPQNLKEKKFATIAEVKDKTGSFYVVRKGRINSRVIPMDKVEGEGDLVKTADLQNERDYESPEEKTAREQKEKDKADAKAKKELEKEAKAQAKAEEKAKKEQAKKDAEAAKAEAK